MTGLRHLILHWGALNLLKQIRELGRDSGLFAYKDPAAMADFQSFLKNIEMNEERYLGILAKLMGEVEHLQNNPAQGLTPQENRASDHIIAALKPYTKENGGPLEVERVEFTAGRGNLIVKYKGQTDRTMAFVGSHLDVVPANPETWERNPFELSREGDMLYGRGTTDCLGHVALITELLIQVAEQRPTLKRTLIIVFIANEESNMNAGVGVDGLMSAGKLDQVRNGPLFWVDCADSHPCLGTCGMVCWQLKVHGRLFHSGMPHKGINPIELGNVAVAEILKRFYADFPPHAQEKDYNFTVSSSMKPTQVECARGSLNQIPPYCTFSGDIRLTPFYDIKVMKAKVESYITDLNSDITQLPSLAPYSKYAVPEENIKGRLEFEWIGEGENGIAVKLQTEGNQALTSATEEVLGHVKPYSITGSLPLVRTLQDADFDVQLVGYGMSSRYHAENEAANLKDFRAALKILARVIGKLEA